MPYQSMMAATFNSSVLFGLLLEAPPERSPGQVLSKPADIGSTPVISAKWPPADWPLVMILLVSKLYCAAFRYTQRSAQRASSTAAGASATFVIRYSTFTTVQPICRYGSSERVEASLVPFVQPPPCKKSMVAFGAFS